MPADWSCCREGNTRRAYRKGRKTDGAKQDVPTRQVEPEVATESTRRKMANRAFSAWIHKIRRAHLPSESVSQIAMFHMCSCSEHITLTWATASDLVYCALGGCIRMCKCGLLIHNTLQNYYSESCRVLLHSRHVKIGRVPTGTVI